MRGVKDTREFALYKGDDLVAMGTLDEIAEKRGTTRMTVRYYGYQAYRRRANEATSLRLIPIEDDDAE